MWQIVINGPGYFDTPYDLPEGTTTLGRADENDIVLSGDLVSRKHAKIHAKGESLQLEDLGSRNGSRINGEPLNGTIPLKVGDTVNVGENTLSVRQPKALSPDAAATEMVDLEQGGVKRYSSKSDVEPMVILSKTIHDSVVMRALDNFGPVGPSPMGDIQAPAPQPPVAYDSLLLLYKVAEKLGTARTLQEFLEAVTDRVMSRVNATTAVVLLRHHSGLFIPATVRHRGQLGKGEVPVSDSILNAALAQGAALAVRDVRDDKRFARKESVILYGADQIFCVPLGPKQNYVGALYLNRTGDDKEEDLEPLLDVCSAVSHLIASGIEKFQLRDKAPGMERLKRSLERFHAPDIVDRRAGELAGLGGGRVTKFEESTATVLFADLAGFTPLTQRLAPDRVVDILSEFYQRMAGVIFSFEGTVDKFMGDGVMAIFGAPYTKGDDALRAVRSALAMQTEWDKACARRPEKERTQLKIGLNTGKVLAGTVGSELRLDYTAVGEAVNVAYWLSNSALPGQLLITGKTLAAVGARFDVTPLGERLLRSPKDKVAVFEVVEEDAAIHTMPGLR